MQQESTFEEFENPEHLIRRKDLLPLWIKIFSWIFLIIGGISILILIFGFFITNINLEVYGIETNSPYSIEGLIILSSFILKGITAYGLLFEKHWATNLAKIDAILGIIICLFSMFILPFILGTNKISIRLELIVLYFYLRKINQIHPEWINIKN